MSFLSDNFSTVSNGSDLTTDSNVTWTKASGTSFAGALLADSTSRIYASIGTNSFAWYTAEANLPAAADYTVTGTFTLVSQVGTIGVGARLGSAAASASATGYWLRYRAFHGFELCRLDSGGATTILGSVSASDPTAGQTVTLALQVSGSTISGTLSGALTGSFSTTDATYASAGYAGLIGTVTVTATTGMHCTSITGTDAAAGGAPAPRPAVASAELHPSQIAE